MSRACDATERLLDARRAGLSEAAQLVLELHLGECARCAQLARELDVVLSVLDSAPRTLERASRERVIERALGALNRPQPLPARRARSGWLVALSAAAALALGWLALRDTAQPVASLPDRVPAASQPSAPQFVAPADGSVAQFAHARVVSTGNARMRFSAETATLELAQGELDVEVDPAAHAPFHVRTPAFTVDVLGTGFRVSARHVEVRHGRVRVVASDGALLASELGAGQRYDVGVRAEEPANPPTVHEAAHDTPPHHLPSSRMDVALELKQARSALARGDATRARSLLLPLKRAARGASQRAEVDSLVAECALVSGDRALAERLYLAVSERYRSVLAGENALFAAHGLARRRGDEPRAHELSKRYLKRYPGGTFSRELAARTP